MLCHCRRQSLLTVIEYAFVPRDTSLSELNAAIRSLTSVLGCEATVTVTDLCAHGVLYGESKPIVQEPTVSNGIPRVAIFVLLFTQCLQISSSNQPNTLETPCC